MKVSLSKFIHKAKLKDKELKLKVEFKHPQVDYLSISQSKRVLTPLFDSDRAQRLKRVN